MIDYETYKRKFGTKDKRSNEYIASISQDIYEMLNQEDRLGIAFQNEITLALAEDVIIAIGTCMMTDDKDKRLSSWKKLGDVIKKVLLNYPDDDYSLNERYYEIAPSPEDRELFLNNPMVTAKGDITHNVSAVLVGLSKFYRAMNTNVGDAVYQAIIKEKKKAIEELYDKKTTRNGSSSYFNVLNFILNDWGRRISTYESYSSSLKFINRSVKDARRK